MAVSLEAGCRASNKRGPRNRFAQPATAATPTGAVESIEILGSTTIIVPSSNGGG